MPSLEDIYLFRHAAYRDVAYALQLPSERARLHAAAFHITEAEFADAVALVASELADHARLARDGASLEEAAGLAKSELHYLKIAMDRLHARAQWENLLHAADHALACPGCEGAIRIEALGHRAMALQNMGRRLECVDTWLAVAMAGDELGIEKPRVQGRSSAALVVANIGEHARAKELIDEAEALSRQFNNDLLLSSTLMNRAMLSNLLGDAAENERLLLLALETFPKGSDSEIQWSIRGNLANMYSNSGRREEGIAAYLELLEILRGLGDRRQESIALANLGRQYLVGGELEQAEKHLLQAIEIATELGNLRSVGFAQANLASVDLQRGNFARAESAILQALEIAREYALVVYHAAYQSTWALLQLLQGHEQEAKDAAEDSRAEFSSVGGDAFIPEFCGIVRLRIAAWQAVSMPVPGRSTSRLSAEPPSPSWLVVMRTMASEIQKAREERGASAAAGLVEAADTASALVAEIAAAIKERRPALIFRGYLPGEMRVELRRALLERLSAGEGGALKSLHPDLWKALHAGL
ncbi:MAG: tetratricopeptide repeat protein [Planctomycetes bacterium]|nr:tetratricopeptide repeat protein [Planctomycetota bacterium]